MGDRSLGSRAAIGASRTCSACSASGVRLPQLAEPNHEDGSRLLCCSMRSVSGLCALECFLLFAVACRCKDNNGLKLCMGRGMSRARSSGNTNTSIHRQLAFAPLCQFRMNEITSLHALVAGDQQIQHLSHCDTCDHGCPARNLWTAAPSGVVGLLQATKHCKQKGVIVHSAMRSCLSTSGTRVQDVSHSAATRHAACRAGSKQGSRA